MSRSWLLIDAVHLRIVMALIGLVLVAGCSAFDKLTDQYVVNSAIVPNSKHPTTGAKSPGPINLDCYYFNEDQTKDFFEKPDACAGWEKPKNNAERIETAYVTVQKKMSDPTGKGLRNRLIEIILTRSNEICDIHKAHILANAAAFDFTTGFTSTLLSGISAAVGGEVAKTALSAASASFGTLGESIRANFYQSILAPAVVRKINKLREEKLGAIARRMKESASSFTIDRSILLINEYHHECSFYRGITELAEGPKPMTRSVIDAEIIALADENSALEEEFKDVTDLSKNPIARDALKQWEINNTRLLQLRLMRNNTPLRGTSPPPKKDNEPADGADNGAQAEGAGGTPPAPAPQ